MDNDKDKYISELTVKGFRGFSEERKIEFAVPQAGKAGSGLTFLIGANNSGKSTIIECIRLLNRRDDPSIPLGQRNIATDQKVTIQLTWHDGSSYVLKSTRGSATELKPKSQTIRIDFIPARRNFNHMFGRGLSDSAAYRFNMENGSLRTPPTHQLTSRLQAIHDNDAQYRDFNSIVKRILGEPIEWVIELGNDNQYYLSISSGKFSHNSEGLGDGIISVFYIANALLESDKHDQRVAVIIIDEPELSLQPAIQKRLMRIFKEYAQRRQIIIATHSPYFFDFESLFNGATLHRVYKDQDGGVSIGSLAKTSIDALENFPNNRNNPHILGLDARAAFFLSDNVVIFEGQEDVYYHPKIAESMGEEYKGEIYGWGAGGAENVEHLCNVFRDLGYSKVFCILDKNKENLLASLRQKFPIYEFKIIPADDVRDKEGIEGLLESVNPIKVKDQYKEEMIALIKEENIYSPKIRLWECSRNCVRGYLLIPSLSLPSKYTSS